MTESDREQLELRVMRHEGEIKERGRHMPYQDSVGKWTIGHGRNLSDRGLSDDEAALLLTHDLDDAIRECAATFPWFVDETTIRQQVLVELLFNMGKPTLLGFKNTLRLWAAGDHIAAAAHLRKSNWYRQVGGDVGQRGHRLAFMLETGRIA